MKPLPVSWQQFLADEAETSKDAQTGDVVLRDGRAISNVVCVAEKFVSEVRRQDEILCEPDDIVEIKLTHERWRFR